VYRIKQGRLEVLLAHPGGPFFVRKDYGHWTIPKGEIDAGRITCRCSSRVEGRDRLEIDPKSDFLELGIDPAEGWKNCPCWGVEQDWDDTQPFQSSTLPWNGRRVSGGPNLSGSGPGCVLPSRGGEAAD